MNDTGFAMVLSNLRIPPNLLPFEIDSRVSILKANNFQMAEFKKVMVAGGYFSGSTVPFQAEITEIELGDGARRIQYCAIPDAVQYVIEFSGFNAHLEYLKHAGLLIRPKLRFGMESQYRDPSKTIVGLRGMLSYYQLELIAEGNRLPFADVSEDYLPQLRHYHGIILKGFPQNSRVGRALSLYADTDRLRPDSVLLTLSYFSILESLITNGRIDMESITHQLKNKLKLILRRVANPPDGSLIFGGITYDKLWSKLYGFRSDIAHGNVYEFPKDYPMLKSIGLVNDYLDTVLAAVIRLAIDEPELVEDLRLC
jgi:hypothetical protein